MALNVHPLLRNLLARQAGLQNTPQEPAASQIVNNAPIVPQAIPERSVLVQRTENTVKKPAPVMETPCPIETIEKPKQKGK
jgi:hypothetical protein